jgi:hypothetical protein
MQDIVIQAMGREMLSFTDVPSLVSCPGDFDASEILTGSRPLNRFPWSRLGRFALYLIAKNEPRPEGAVEHCYRYD